MKNVIVTGASSGIGLELTRQLAAKGFNVLACARSFDKLQKIAKEFPEKIFPFELDVTDYDQVAQMILESKSTCGQIDVLVNNAGIGFFEKLAEGQIERWHAMLDVNVKGLLNCFHAALPSLIESKGHIVNISSVAGRQVFTNSGVYCATKHAVHAISESIRLELSDRVRVTTISPGAIDTGFLSRTTDKELLEEYVPYFASGLTAAEVAREIVHAIESPSRIVLSEIIIRPNRKNK